VRAALIPPKGYEEEALHSDIHLVLPLASLRRNLSYLRTYATARARGHYIILDNGCAENQLANGEDLLNFARAIKPHEIVAPDVMNDAAATLEATNAFLDEYGPEASNYNIMGVLQGQELSDRQFLLKKYAQNSLITAIGIPKVLVTHEDLEIRRKIARAIHRVYPKRFKIHLLGLNSIYPQEMYHVQFEGVRSMDSAQPFKLAEVGKQLTTIDAWSTRRSDYFTVKKEVDPRVLAANIRIFKEWAGQ